MLLIGHRGAPAEAPENTRAAFDAALDAGADGIEMDLRLTADGALAVSHDDSLGRAFGVDLRVSAVTMSELRTAASVVPSVEEILDAYGGRTLLYLECKGIFEPGRFVSAEPAARALLPLIDGIPGVTVSSFDPLAVAAVKAAAPQVTVGIGCGEMFDVRATIDAAGVAGYQQVHPADALVDADVCDAAVRAGVGLVVWTVNDPFRATVLRDLGVAGVFTDDPRGMRRAGL